MDDPRNIFVDQRNEYQNPAQGDNPTAQTPPPFGANTQKVKATQGQNADDYQQKVTEMKRLAEKYQREGEGQLVKDIVNSVIEQKARGQLTNEQLLAFAKRVTPLLNADQRQRLNELVEQLLKL